METEFDKEMDALLRKAAGRGVLVGGDARSHLDADMIAAFAENALPVKSRTIYTQHLAECNPCRISLANMIRLNEAEPALAAAAAPVPTALVPWYRRLFRAPNLAYVMGGLVLVFGGLFGVFLLQNAFNNKNASVSMIQPEQAPQTAPALAEGANSLPAENANANAASNAAGEIPQSVGVADAPVGESNTAVVTQPLASTTTSNTADTALAKPAPVDSLDKDKSLAIAPAAAPPPAKEAAKREEDEKTKNEARVAATQQEARKQDNSVNVYSNQQNQVQMMPGAGNKTSGPSRADVQRDNRAYDSRPMDDKDVRPKKAEKLAGSSADGYASSTRSVGGKTFELKQGAWYDTSFQGQATKNVQRGADEFRKLDSGLRNIANSISGTVVVVWKGKAYRIQ